VPPPPVPSKKVVPAHVDGKIDHERGPGNIRPGCHVVMVVLGGGDNRFFAAPVAVLLLVS